MTADPVLYQTLARYNAWMNGKLYAACAELPDAERKADRGAYFGSIHSTLNHILFGDRAWMNRLAGAGYETKPIGDDLFEDFDALRAARTQMDADLEAWTTDLAPETLTRTFTWTSGIDGKTRTHPLWLLTPHMFNHQTHHRGQITTLLSQAGQDVGSTDLPWGPWFETDGA